LQWRVRNQDGLIINFEPADLKALAGASYFFVEKYSQMGLSTPAGHKAYDQPNPAVFDIALRYFVGEMKKSFVIDSHLGPEVWNESVVGFSREMGAGETLTSTEKEQHPTAISKLHIKLKLFLLGEIKIRDSNRETKGRVAAGALHEEMPVSYTLYLDAQGKAIDGIWDPSKTLRGVDFAWFSGGVGTDSKNPEGNGNPRLSFELIEKLVKKSNILPLCRSILRMADPIVL
jgi:hypothetical protein